MDIKTHTMINRELSGSPQDVSDGSSRIEMETTEQMAADEFGLVHGGFVFSLADYAAMLAVNHPNVVLGSAEVTFQKPVRVGETLIADATVRLSKGKKRIVEVDVKRGDVTIFTGTFTCFVLDRHVLEPPEGT